MSDSEVGFGRDSINPALGWRELYDENVIPEQVKRIESTTVGSLEDKVGTQIASALSKSPSGEPSSPQIATAMYWLRARTTDDSAEVFELSCISDNQRKSYIVVQGSLSPSTGYIEVFDTDFTHDPERSDKYNFRYLHDLIIDKESGKVADLMDLKMDAYPLTLQLDNMLGASDPAVLSTGAVRMVRNSRRVGQSISYTHKKHEPIFTAHELGHTVQQEGLKKLAQEENLRAQLKKF